MIQHTITPHTPPSRIHLNILRKSTNEVQIETGLLKDPSTFSKDRTILIGLDNPKLLWGVLYDLIGIPIPDDYKIKSLKPTEQESSTVIEQSVSQTDLSLTDKLKQLSSKEIVAMVEKEKGIKITNSLKSKAAIISKVLKIYN